MIISTPPPLSFHFPSTTAQEAPSSSQDKLQQIVSSSSPSKKTIIFRHEGDDPLLLPISNSDPASAITTMVREFFGLHRCGISFQDTQGRMLIITPMNLVDQMEVNVCKISSSYESSEAHSRRSSATSSTYDMPSDDLTVRSSDIKHLDIPSVSNLNKFPDTPAYLSADVSLDNVVEGSRRKRFRMYSDSSNSLSTVGNSSIAVQNNHYHDKLFPGIEFTDKHHITRGSNSTHYGPQAFYNGNNGIPTPATLSVISDEDVAMQLIRLGGNSPSVNSSTFTTSGTPHYRTDGDSMSTSSGMIVTTPQASDALRAATNGLAAQNMGAPPLPTGAYSGARCIRCKKTKKGCDRRRPCQRCMDAGLDPWECVSEAETTKSRGGFRRRRGADRRK